jgi:hypothetical protein
MLYAFRSTDYNGDLSRNWIRELFIRRFYHSISWN